MPLSKHYGGHGAKVMAAMKKQYGPEKAERVFYATENKMKSQGGMASHLNSMKSKGLLKSKKTK